jgi:ferritin-like metal-binding protein YciE
MNADKTQIVKYLADVHSVELQALAQMQLAPRVLADAQLAEVFREHRRETEEHERVVHEQLRSHGARSSAVKDLAGRVGGWGMILFARMNPDTAGKLVAHAFSYEHMELAAYELLRRVAERGEEPAVAKAAGLIGRQEQLMADRLQRQWPRAVDVALREKGSVNLDVEIVKYLRDAHALESQSLQLLRTGRSVVGEPTLSEVFTRHETQTREHGQLLGARLAELGAHPARIQDTALRVGAVGLGTFFIAQPDTPIKLAGFAYAFEALEQAGYGLLALTAHRAGDERTAQLAERIMAEELQAAQSIAGCWDAVTELIAG